MRTFVSGEVDRHERARLQQKMRLFFDRRTLINNNGGEEGGGAQSEGLNIIKFGDEKSFENRVMGFRTNGR